MPLFQNLQRRWDNAESRDRLAARRLAGAVATGAFASALAAKAMGENKNVDISQTDMAYKKGTRKPKTQFKKKTTKSGKKFKGNVLALRKEVRSLSKSVKSDQARHTHRRRDVQAIGANARQMIYGDMNSYTNTNVLEAAMAFLRYYDPAVPGTLVTANAATGTYTRQVHFESIYEKLKVRNNYQVPAMVHVYSCIPKNDTNITVTSYYSAGIADQGSGLASTDPLLQLSDIRMVKDNWNCKLSRKVLLQPGSEINCTRAHGPFDYDPSNVDTHSSQFQKKYGAHMWIIRVEGTLAHDTAAAEYLTTQAQVDAQLDYKFVMTYDAGVNLDDFSTDDNSSASFTNGGVVSNKPVSDNQSYSVA